MKPYHAREAARKGQKMADGNEEELNRRRHEPRPEQRSPTTLLPMLIGGLVLIVIGMAVVMAIT